MQPAEGEAALTGGLDYLISGGPFQPQPLSDFSRKPLAGKDPMKPTQEKESLLYLKAGNWEQIAAPKSLRTVVLSHQQPSPRAAVS